MGVTQQQSLRITLGSTADVEPIELTGGIGDIERRDDPTVTEGIASA